jgi:hypothetical protein
VALIFSAAALALFALGLTSLTAGALAGESEPGGGGPVGIPDPTDTGSTGCKYYTWPTMPKLVIHLGESKRAAATARRRSS